MRRCKHSPIDMIRHDRAGSVRIALELSDTPGMGNFALPKQFSAPPNLILRAVDDAREATVIVKTSAPELMVASWNPVFRAGTHLRIGGDVDRPGLTIIGGEVHAADVRIHIAAARPSCLAVEEHYGMDRTATTESTA